MMSCRFHLAVGAILTLSVASSPSIAKCTGGMSLNGCISAPAPSVPSTVSGLVRNYPIPGPGYLIDQMGQAWDRNVNNTAGDDDGTETNMSNSDDDDQ
jgi:hypothetical protein